MTRLCLKWEAVVSAELALLIAGAAIAGAASTAEGTAVMAAAEATSREELLGLVAEQLYYASEDILFFSNFVKTHDSHAQGERIQPFPVEKKYIGKLLGLGAKLPRLVVYKSRQMLVTWIMCIVCLWEALFKPGSVIALISLKEEDAGKLIGRIKTIYDHLPDHWKPFLPTVKFYKGKKGIILRMVVQHHDFSGEPDSTIEAFPQNGNPGRGETLSLVYWDEVGECDDQECRNMYAALRPTLENGGRLIMSSTPPRHPEHFFEQLCTNQYFQS